MKKLENGSKGEFGKFGTATRKILSVPHEELKRREEKWKKERKRKEKSESEQRGTKP
jgi:hypothetical protein